MLSLSELRRAGEIIREELSGASLRRISQSEAFAIVLTYENAKQKYHLLLSSRSEFARICAAELSENSSPGSFFEFLRAHLIGSILSEVNVFSDDRSIELKLQTRTETYFLILSILGTRSNIYLLDGDKQLAHSLRPLDDTRRELKIGEPWIKPQGTVPFEGVDRWEAFSGIDYLNEIARTYSLLERKKEAELLGRRIEQALKKERGFIERKAVNLREDLGEARQAEKHKQIGELLKNSLHLVKPGDDKILGVDYETGKEFEIELNPSISPAANLQAYFAKYQKETRGVKIIEQQMAEIDASLAEIASIERPLTEALSAEMPDMEELNRIAALPIVSRLIQRATARKSVQQPASSKSGEKKEIPTRLMPKKYRTQDGLEIWVGRSDESNDYLTTKLARGNDLFFHLEGYPGSHVILRTEGRTDPPPKSILDACELAVHFSKMKNAGSADVHVAPIKNVKKPKGAKTGLVYVRSGKTIHLRRDSKRLENILASRQ